MLNTHFRNLFPLFVASLITGGCATAQSAAAGAYGRLPLTFEVNQGQTDARVKFLSQGPGYMLFLTANEAVLALPALKRLGNPGPGKKNPSNVAMRLIGANPAPSTSGLEKLAGTSNYFIGNDPAKWRTDIPNYAKVQYSGVYPGVNLVYYGSQGRLEYDFVVAAGSDPRAIELAFESVDRDRTKVRHQEVQQRINGSGDLVLSFDGNEVLLHKPTAYQLVTDHGRKAGVDARRLIEAHYVLKGSGQVGIRLGPYDATKDLVIDPVLTYASRLGGSNDQIGAGIAVDSGGNVYVTGTTESFDFPVVNQARGACQGVCSTSFDVAYVTKINAAGNALVYSSRIGGSTFDEGFGIGVDTSGNAYLVGLTESADFPRVNQIAGACVGACGTAGSQDVFAAKINATGDALVYSSVLGGSNNDAGFAIAVDPSGNAYLTGLTDSPDFPRVNPIPGACLGTCGAGSFPQDAFVAEVNAAGTALVYSSHLAGSAFTEGFGIAADSAGSAYIVGLTQSADFPRVNQIPGACVGTCGGGASSDGFVTKVNPRGASLAYSSVFGGSGFDMGSAIAVDNSGNAYLTGSTQSADFPQLNSINRACTHGCGAGGTAPGDAFVTKINSAGSAIVYSSLAGCGVRRDKTGVEL
jgi:hypothetical protein